MHPEPESEPDAKPKLDIAAGPSTGPAGVGDTEPQADSAGAASADSAPLGHAAVDREPCGSASTAGSEGDSAAPVQPSAGEAPAEGPARPPAARSLQEQLDAADAVVDDSAALAESRAAEELVAEPDAGPGDLEDGEPPAAARPRSLWWLDLLVFLALAAISAAGFYQHARGDLYSDEADYALASTRGFEANRWDRSDSPREPDRLVAGRHYHAPLTVDLIAIAHRFGADDHTIRMPFVVAGGLAIGAVYLCGLALFDRRREIAAACALLAAISPAIVRMASHALPWSPIILELMLLLWCLAEYARDRDWRWITGAMAVMGLLFVTSEMFFVAGASAMAAVAILFGIDMLRGRQQARRARGIGLYDADAPAPTAGPQSGRAPLAWLAIGAALFLGIAVVVWPCGLAGESVRMLRHYIMMRHSESFPVNVGSSVYLVAPKWSYAYWYWNDYRPFFAVYALAAPGLIGLAVARRLNAGVVPLLALSALLLFAAHRAHIIGPEYLAHCLPFLTLMGGLALYGLSLAWRPLATLAILLIAVPILRWSPRVPLPGMDARAQLSRWPAAARALAASWQPGDKIMVGSQPVNVAHWYLVYLGGVPNLDSQFQPMPIHAPKPLFLQRLAGGYYRYAAVSNMFEDHVDLDPKTAQILRAWRVAWRSDEHGAGPSRLVIYRCPR
ncbi:MAG TPA: glycosyltransferase family 39 protein [Chthonomonadaceae bacterium]|nr:glycosyltransferase family 39 protein [Chthonomonadaceae bacterium]